MNRISLQYLYNLFTLNLKISSICHWPFRKQFLLCDPGSYYSQRLNYRREFEGGVGAIYRMLGRKIFFKRQQQLFLETITGSSLPATFKNKVAAKLLKSEVYLNKRVRRDGILERNITGNNKLRLFSFA